MGRINVTSTIFEGSFGSQLTLWTSIKRSCSISVTLRRLRDSRKTPPARPFQPTRDLLADPLPLRPPRMPGTPHPMERRARGQLVGELRCSRRLRGLIFSTALSRRFAAPLMEAFRQAANAPQRQASRHSVAPGRSQLIRPRAYSMGTLSSNRLEFIVVIMVLVWALTVEIKRRKSL